VRPLVLFYLMLRASLLSTSGFGNLPILHDDLIERGWATERQFAESLAIGQLTPGPNGLWVVSFAFMLDGLRGALLAVVAIVLPSLFVLLVDRLYRRVKEHPAIEGFLHGLSVATVGIFAIVMAQVLSSAQPGMLSYVILLAAFALGTIRRIPLVAIILGAALTGALCA
jgi:chromate transporter